MSFRARAASYRYIARHPVQMLRISPAVVGMHNRRSKRTLERGRTPRISGVSAAISSRMPVYRNRINPSTGRKNRDNGYMHKIRNEGLARLKTSERQDLVRIATPMPRLDVSPRPARHLPALRRGRSTR